MTVTVGPRIKQRDTLMLPLLKKALRAWIKADAEEIPEALRLERLKLARKLTGDAVSAGFLSGKDE